MLHQQLENRDFQGALKTVERFSEEKYKTEAFRNIALVLIQAGRESEGFETLENLFTEEEKTEARSLEERLENIGDSAEVNEQLQRLTDIFTRQSQMYDLGGARKTLLKIAGCSARFINPLKKAQNSFLAGETLARLGFRKEAWNVLKTTCEQITGIVPEERYELFRQIVPLQLELIDESNAPTYLSELVPMWDSIETFTEYHLTINLLLLKKRAEFKVFEGNEILVQKIRDMIRSLHKEEDRLFALFATARVLVLIEFEKRE